MASQPDFTNLAIDSLADQGDGVATADGKRIFVPLTLPGDVVDAVRANPTHARAIAWHRRGPHRQEPPCPHFGACGGCALQHLDPSFYRAWKIARIGGALARRHVQTPVIAPLAETPPACRRRVSFAARRGGRQVELGFHARESHAIVTIAQCPVAHPALVALLGPLRALFAEILPAKRAVDALATVSDGGIDLLLDGIGAGERSARERLAAFAAENELARLALREGKAAPDIVAIRRPPRFDFDGVTVEPPPGAFLQASIEGERAIRAAVREAIGDARRVADLYAGCGTIALPLARAGARVHAVEGLREQLEALDRAARAAGLGPRVSVETRDLARRPLLADELKRFDAVIFDPPRDGAAAQAAQLAQSKVARIVGVSCNPATFARDAATLQAGGYALTHVVPIDQFLWSAHVELVGRFERR